MVVVVVGEVGGRGGLTRVISPRHASCLSAMFVDTWPPFLRLHRFRCWIKLRSELTRKEDAVQDGFVGIVRFHKSAARLWGGGL